jgi:hypothetical protein
VQRKEGGKKKGRGETEADRWDPPVGAAVKKKGEGGEAVGRRGKLGWAVWAEWVAGSFCFFLFFSFSNFIFKSIFNSN